jgi:hypothetical protein
MFENLPKEFGKANVNQKDVLIFRVGLVSGSLEVIPLQLLQCQG